MKPIVALDVVVTHAMTAREIERCARRGEAVFFYWRGLLTCSPILRVNRTTIRVATSHGERLIPKANVLRREGGA